MGHVEQFQEEALRAFIVAGLLVATTAGAALADPSVAGNWRADMNGGVSISMNVSPDGKWSSETYQQKKTVRQMRGTYTQTKSNDNAGVLVFTPTQATVQTGKVKPETDQYELGENAQQLKLTSEGDTMVFNKQTKP